MKERGVVVVTETKFQVLFNRDVLGKEFEVHLNRNKITIHTPNNTPTNYVGYLGSPEKYKELKEIYFGHVFDSRTGETAINSLVIEMNTAYEDESKIVNDYSRIIDSYLKQFNDWAIVKTGQLFTENEVNQDYEKTFFWESSRERIRISPNVKIICNLRNGIRLADVNDVENILHKIERNECFGLDFEYYKKAILNYRYEEYRECVLNSATACEIAISNIIRNALSCGSLEEKDVIMNNISGLSQLCRFAKELGLPIPKFNQDYISKPRNKAIHRGDNVSAEQAKKSLLETRKVICDFL